MFRIVTSGTGYVGLFLDCLLTLDNEVSTIDISENKVEKYTINISKF